MYLITEYSVSEDINWSLFNYVFSDSGRKRNTYKIKLVKILLDNVFNGQNIENGIKYTYEELFSRFFENYRNLVIKYCEYEFMLKYKVDIERLNYCSWARFLEQNK